MIRLRVIVPLYVLALSSTFAAEVPQAIQCISRTDIERTVRKESVADLIGDIVINCSGGTPAQPGQPIPTASLRVTLNGTVSSKSLGSNVSEAMLLIDNPSPAAQRLGTETGAYVSGDAIPNVFLARQVGPNSLEWLGIPVLPPGETGTRTFRLTNVRVNPAGLNENDSLRFGASFQYGDGTQIPMTIENSKAGVVLRGLNFDVQSAGSIPSGTPYANNIGVLSFREGFPNAFRRRNIATNSAFGTLGPQNTFPLPFDTESGFYAPDLNPSAGLVDTGTRFKAIFENIPDDAQIYVRGIPDPTNPSSSSARAIQSCDGPPVLMPLQPNNFFSLPVVNGTGVACWEVAGADPSGIDNFTFTVDMVYSPMTPLTQTSLIRVRGFLAPNPTLPSYLRQQSSFQYTHGFTFLSDEGSTRLAEGYLGLIMDVPLGEIRASSGSSQPNFGRYTGTGNTFAPECPIPRFGEEPGCRLHYFSGMTRAAGLVVNQSASTSRNSSIREGTTNWLTATSTSNTAPIVVDVAVNPAGLGPGTYSGSVTVTSGTAGVGPATIPVTYTVPAAGPLVRAQGFGVGNAGSYASNVVAPGEAIVIFGDRFGPADLATLTVTNGTVDTLLAGTRVLFDGVPSPMIYAVNGQISCFVPFGVAGQKFTTMEVEYNGVKSPAVRLAVAAAVPGLLTADQSGGGLGAILNQDSSFNSITGALPGETVQIFGTGGGVTVPAAQDGRINNGGALALPVKVFLDGVEVPAAYAGPAPGLVEGVFQVNVQVPSSTRRNSRVPVVVKIGDYSSQPGVTIIVR